MSNGNLQGATAGWRDVITAYQNGFGNEFATEAEEGALPARNNPLRAPLGLYSELFTATSFGAAREHARRSYMFRIRPSVTQGRLELIDAGLFASAPFGELATTQMRWDPLSYPQEAQDFVDGLATLLGNGSALLQSGMAIHSYLATRSMEDTAFVNCDAETLIVPQEGSLRVITEMGVLDVEPCDLLLIPRGMKFSVVLRESRARGFMCENFGRPLQLPSLGPLGTVGLANPWDFKAPQAYYEDRDTDFAVKTRFGGRMWRSKMDHSPFDVVAWRGNCAPFKFNMLSFIAMGSSVADHPDPSIYTALTSPADPVLGSNMDLLVFPPRWHVGNDTFRPAPFHRNSATEFSALLRGAHESKAGGAQPGSFVLHNSHLPHGPDVTTYERASNEDGGPVFTGESLMFAIETRLPLAVTPFASDLPQFQTDYPDCWNGFANNFRKNAALRGDPVNG